MIFLKPQPHRPSAWGRSHSCRSAWSVGFLRWCLCFLVLSGSKNRVRTMSEAGPLLPLFPHTASWFPTLLPSLLLWTWPRDSAVPLSEQRSPFPTAGMLGLAPWLVTRFGQWHVGGCDPSIGACPLASYASDIAKRKNVPAQPAGLRNVTFISMTNDLRARECCWQPCRLNRWVLGSFVTQRKLTDKLPTLSPWVCVDKAFLKRIHKSIERCMWSNI